MDNHILTDLIRTKLASGELTRAELQSILDGTSTNGTSANQPPSIAPTPVESSHLNISKVFLYLGGLIVLIGFSVFVAQFWSDLGSALRIAIALGGALAAFAIGVFFSRTREESEIAAPFHLIAGVLFPFGAYVLLSELGIDIGLGTWVLMFAALTMVYAITAVFVRYLLVTFFLVANATALLYALAEYLLRNTDLPHWENYFGMLMGIGYLYLGKRFLSTYNAPLSRFLFFFGSCWTVSASFLLYSSLPLWPLAYPLIIVAMISFSLSSKQLTPLVISSIGIMAYVAYITGKYFADSLGWPIALMIIGLAFIGIGYGTFYIRSKYLRA